MPQRICATCIYYEPKGQMDGYGLCTYPIPLAMTGARMYAEADWKECPCWTEVKIGGSECGPAYRFWG